MFNFNFYFANARAFAEPIAVQPQVQKEEPFRRLILSAETLLEEGNLNKWEVMINFTPNEFLELYSIV